MALSLFCNSFSFLAISALPVAVGGARELEEVALLRAVYFSRLVDGLSELVAGDQVLLADWRGDDDELLGPEGPRLGALLSGHAARGIEIRGLLWRSHPQMFGFSEEEASELAGVVNGAGGQLLLDERVAAVVDVPSMLMAAIARQKRAMVASSASSVEGSSSYSSMRYFASRKGISTDIHSKAW